MSPKKPELHKVEDRTNRPQASKREGGFLGAEAHAAFMGFEPVNGTLESLSVLIGSATSLVNAVLLVAHIDWRMTQS